MSEWQTIETAPKDVEILVNTPADGVVSSVFKHGCWQKLTTVYGGDLNNEPTHWMPLPDPPEDV